MHDAVHRLYQEFFTFKIGFQELKIAVQLLCRHIIKKCIKIGQKISKAQMHTRRSPT